MAIILKYSHAKFTKTMVHDHNIMCLLTKNLYEIVQTQGS